ncbi:hypothetical protein QN386_15735 [Pseudomonas sp. CCI3.2]|uniref:hypothetical protein n=1 Tax=unclassified Pseudomonas TaxID=196821 RepID=UPI002AC9D5E8|nr:MULTISPECIES: hypothetical protein [unclassified Pseudomonas]MEB0075837.1 hypothetical protein [Pseudomonas sp. MH10out]MEB0102765.1 hypothetical protein [Pseudomonas sp. CCI3.2]MEB0131591.1 hypothetical protein [Pseudomonas sp. CCI2.4]MEB0156484.1 hypothetical protein [Pseudomonas sp. AH2 (2023)]MEB0170105.1 hypothetical protein [Pseudomonas sp. CCC4.4]
MTNQSEAAYLGVIDTILARAGKCQLHKLADVAGKATRFGMMSSIWEETTQKLSVRSFLYFLELSVRLHGKLRGRPGMIFQKYSFVFFTHNCFRSRY